MNKITILLIALMLSVAGLNAQSHSKDSTGLQISGTADIYYKYDFAQSATNTPAKDNLFGTLQNSLNFGVLDLRLKKKFGKVSFYSDIALGARPDTKPVDPANSYHIQSLYVAYQLNPKLQLSAGVMYRYESFEKLNPTDNFHYSLTNSFRQSFLTNPRTAGIRGMYKFSDKVSLSAAFFNSIDPKAPSDNISAAPFYGVSDFSSQLIVNPVKDLQLSAAIWVEGQKANGTHTNFQAKYKYKSTWKLSFDGNILNASDGVGAANSFRSAALYLQKDLCKVFTLGGRYEYFDQVLVAGNPKEHYNIYTLTGCLKLGAIQFKAEGKFDFTTKDNAGSNLIGKDGLPTYNASQFIAAAIYSF